MILAWEAQISNPARLAYSQFQNFPHAVFFHFWSFFQGAKWNTLVRIFYTSSCDINSETLILSAWDTHLSNSLVSGCVFSCSVMSDSCNPMDCSPPGSWILQARILEWVAISSSRGSSSPGIFCFGRRILYHWATRKPHMCYMLLFNYSLPFPTLPHYLL